MKAIRKIIIVVLAVLLGVSGSQAAELPSTSLAESPATVSAESPEIVPVQTNAVSTDSVPAKKSFLKKVWDYLQIDGGGSTSNEDETPLSMIGGPYYDSAWGFCLSLVGASRFRFHGCDKSQPVSNVALSGTVSSNLFWRIALRGNVFLPKGQRINGEIAVDYQPSYYWGIGYENGNNDNNKYKQPKRGVTAHVEVLFPLAEKLYVGPCLEWNLVNSDTIPDMSLLNGQDRVIHNYGVGAVLEYDTRDLITCAQRGVFIHLGQIFHPKFLWNHYAFSTTDIRANYYCPLWKDCTLAATINGMFNFGNPSWNKMAQIGGDNHMRGYYEGRYRDKHMIHGQVEFRQHVWKRSGVVLWVGGGTVFHDFTNINNFLPNYGVGYRFEFRRRMNIRLDIGFGKKGQSGFMFNMNEAF